MKCKQQSYYFRGNLSVKATILCFYHHFITAQAVIVLVLIGCRFNIRNNVNIPLWKKFSISCFRENVLRKMLLVPYQKQNKCFSSLLLDCTFKSPMNNCKVHGAAMNSSPSLHTLSQELIIGYRGYPCRRYSLCFTRGTCSCSEGSEGSDSASFP